MFSKAGSEVNSLSIRKSKLAMRSMLMRGLKENGVHISCRR